MKTVMLTLGPRGAGKTTFCRKVVRARPEVAFVERDAVLVELFGSAALSPYTGWYAMGAHEMIRCVGGMQKKRNISNFPPFFYNDSYAYNCDFWFV